MGGRSKNYWTSLLGIFETFPKDCSTCRLESQCVTAISFVKNEPELLDSPIWVLIINIVALEMLKAKLPLGEDRQHTGD